MSGYECNKPWILQRADPYVFHGPDGRYYFTASYPSFYDHLDGYDRIILRCSSTVAGLQKAEEREVWHKHPSGSQSKHIWAPEIHYIWGKWYIYYAAGAAEDEWAIRPYVLECTGSDPMTDLWVEKGRMQSCPGEAEIYDEFAFQSFSLDATVFETGGEHYFVWSQKVGVGREIANLYIAKMKSPWQLAGPHMLLSSPTYDWERIGFWVNEGPAVLKRNGRIFLTYSGSETGIYYCMGMLTMTEGNDPMDPNSWKKERWPVLASDAQRGLYGPGHNSFTVDEQGRDIMVYHCRTRAEIIGNPLYNPDRHAMIMPLTYDQNGVPVFSYDEQQGD